MNPLPLLARHGAMVLVLGLIAGLLFPGPARHMKPFLPYMVVGLLFLSVLRINPKDVFGSLADLPGIVVTLLILQLGVPLTVLGIAYLGGWMAHPVTLALTLMSAAPSIVGSANICIMLGFAPQSAVRLMVAGSVALPLTVVPVFWLMPELGDISAVLSAVGRLIVIIAIGASSAILVRWAFLRNPSASALINLDGLGALALAIFVVALMPALSDSLLTQPLMAFGWLCVAFGANIGLQIIFYVLVRRRASPDTAVAVGLIGGNRNIALFLAALPAETIAPVLAFIACYQVPMYLTPMIMRSFYRKG